MSENLLFLLLGFGLAYAPDIVAGIANHFRDRSKNKQEFEISIDASKANKELDLLTERCEILKSKMLEINDIAEQKKEINHG